MKLLSVFATLLMATAALAQPKITGPNAVKVGDVTFIDVKASPKASLQVSSVPEDAKDGVRYLKSLDDTLVIVVTLQKPAILLIGVGEADETGKVSMALHLLTVGNIVPAPSPTPKPSPTPDPPPDSEYFAELRAAYMVSPDETQRLKLKAVYETVLSDVKMGRITTNSAAATKLLTAAKPITLTSVKKVNADYLNKQVGKDWNKQKLTDALSTIVASMEMLKVN